MKVYVITDNNNEILAVLSEINVHLIERFESVLDLNVESEEMELDDETIVQVLEKKLQRFIVTIQPGGPNGCPISHASKLTVNEYWKGEEIAYSKDQFSINVLSQSQEKARERAMVVFNKHKESGLIEF